MHIALVNYVYPRICDDPDELLGRYATLRCWGEALLAAGAARVTVGQRFGRTTTVRRAGVDYHFCADDGGPSPRWWTRPTQLHRTLAQLRPDVVHLNGQLFPAQTWLLRRALPHTTALVVQDHAAVVPGWAIRDGRQEAGDRRTATSRGSRLASPVSRLRFLLWRTGLRAADGFLFAAEGLADPWRDAGLIGPGQSIYQVMEGGTTLQPLPYVEARRHSSLLGDPALLWVGRLDENKDPLVVLDGFALARQQLPDAHLTFVYGSEELLPLVSQRVGASPLLAGRVHLAGRVDHQELAAYYSAADLFVLGSHREGSGYALIEALACGATPVVTDIPSFRVLTGGGRVGALWPVGDSPALAQALIEQGHQNLPNQRANVIAHFKQHWSWEAIGQAALEAYRISIRNKDAKSTTPS